MENSGLKTCWDVHVLVLLPYPPQKSPSFQFECKLQKYVYIYLLSTLGALLLYKVLKSFNADDVLKVDWDRLIISINATVTVKCSRTSQEIWMVERCGGKIHLFYFVCLRGERRHRTESEGSCRKGGTNHLLMEKCGGEEKFWGWEVLKNHWSDEMQATDISSYYLKKWQCQCWCYTNLQGAEETETLCIF